MDSSGGFTPPPPPPPPPPGGPGGGGGGGDVLPARGLGDILSAAFEIYKNNARNLLLIVAIVVVPLQLVSALLSNVAFAEKKETVIVSGHSISTTEPRSTAAAALLALLVVIIALVIWAGLQATITRAAARTTIGDDVDVADSYRWGLSRLGSIVLVVLLIGLVLAAGAIVGIFLVFALPAFALLLLFAWALFGLTVFSVAVPAFVVENRRGAAALSRSWNLVKVHFWHAFGTIVLTLIITGIIQRLIGALGGSNWFLRWIFGSIGQILVGPFTALVAVLLYLDLRTRGEALSAGTLRNELIATS
jgi:hypothetical protein